MRRQIELGPELFRFESRRHWVDRAYSWFREHGADGHNAVAIDAKGRLCPTGAQFRRAEEEGAYPVVVYRVEPEEGANMWEALGEAAGWAQPGAEEADHG